tara:strand:+ start:9407 stop:9775 length:369 start_codon:yes stop_codon:yes gene_type:complete
MISACSSFREKEIVTVPTVVEKVEIPAPTIQIVNRPNPVKMKDADIVVVTENNLEDVMSRIKDTQGEFVLYAMTASSFEALALNFEEIKRFIEEQNQIILYYEKAVTPREDNTEDDIQSEEN